MWTQIQSFLHSTFYGALDLPWWGYLIVTAVLMHITFVSITVYLHRYSAHRAIDLHPIVSHFFRFWLWATTGMVTKEWTAIHRKHHAKCETEDDPHSPVTTSIGAVFWQGSEMYRRESRNEETMEIYGKGTPDDWLERHIYSKLNRYGILMTLVLDIVLMGVPGITVWALQMLVAPLFAAGIINGIGHYWGYRNFECPDAARNVFPIGILIVGEELHNNHHTFGTSAKFSVKWYEFDLGYTYIKLLSYVGLAKVRRVAPKPHIIESKNIIDKDTLMAIMTNRYQVLASYSKNVLIPVFKVEKLKANRAGRRLFRRCKKSLVRSEEIVDTTSQQQLTGFLQGNESLNEVYQFRQKLQQIWARSTRSQKELVEALQEWCSQAEKTGVESLREFSRSLRQYSLKNI